MSANVCQRWPGSGGMCWAGSHRRRTWRRPECHWHFFAALVWWARVRRPGKSLCPPEEWDCGRVSFLNWTGFLPARRLDLTWASLAFVGTVRHLPPRTVTDFCGSTLLLPWGDETVPAICWFWLQPALPLEAAFLPQWKVQRQLWSEQKSLEITLQLRGVFLDLDVLKWSENLNLAWKTGVS